MATFKKKEKKERKEMDRKEIRKELEKTMQLFRKEMRNGRETGPVAQDLLVKIESLKLAFDNAPEAVRKPYSRPEPKPDPNYTIIGPCSYRRQLFEQTTVCVFGEVHTDILIKREKKEMSIVDFVRDLALTQRVLFLHESTFFFAKDFDQVTGLDETTIDREGFGFYLAVPSQIAAYDPDRGRVMAMIKHGFRAEIMHPEKNINPRIEQVDIRATNNMIYFLNEIVNLARVGYIFNSLKDLFTYLQKFPTPVPPFDDAIIAQLQVDWDVSVNRQLYLQHCAKVGLERVPDLVSGQKKALLRFPVIRTGPFLADNDDPLYKCSMDMAIYLMKLMMDFYTLVRIRKAVTDRSFDIVVFYGGDAHALTIGTILPILFAQMPVLPMNGPGRLHVPKWERVD